MITQMMPLRGDVQRALEHGQGKHDDRRVHGGDQHAGDHDKQGQACVHGLLLHRGSSRR